MIDTIDLSNYNFVFSETELNNLKRKNFIYGKNGTGKSSLVKAIKEQYSEDYDIRVFNGWRGIIKNNNYLDAIALGETNAAKQTEIDKVDKQINNIEKEIIESQDGTENLFKKYQKTKIAYGKQYNKIEQFYTSSASKISTLLSLGRSYDKRNFKRDVFNANLLSKSDKKKLEATIKAEKIVIGQPISFPKIDLKNYLKATNEILQTAVLPSGIIKELTNNIEKQNFAKMGMKIHNRHLDEEHCSFCGSLISKDRWNELDRYFSNEVEKLDGRILDGLRNIENCIKEINDIIAVDEKQFYPDYKDSLQGLNLEIFELKSSYDEFLKKLKEGLEEKKSKTTIEVSEIEETIPELFSNIQNKYNMLYRRNKEYSDRLNQEKDKAKKKLQLHEVKVNLEKFNYSDKKKVLEELKTQEKLLADDITELENEKGVMVHKRKELIADMTKETTTVIKINQFLNGLGSHSFSLEHAESAEGQKGQYRILDTNGNERSVQTLSDGEKNIVAFLWFMDSLEEPSEIEKEKIIIFDDPMNSNDDGCQYLMMSAIQKFYRQERHPQLFLMTHNNHFYLQVTPRSKKYPTTGRNPEQKYIKFLKSGDQTEIITILNDSDNLKTIYDELWEELKYAYYDDKVTFMWNHMRRILETYNRFYFKNGSPADIEDEFNDSVDKVLSIALVKSLNVNSHVGYETDIDISGKTKDELKDVFYYAFDKLGAGKHFNSYWYE